ncbi:MAG: tetratricopeptide repeat protein, partial [Anaerolineales bacterium]
IGVNLGDVIDDEGRIYGDGVNVAARVEGLAEGGGICISRTAFDQIKNKLNLGYENLGEHSVKNIAEPVRVYKVLMEPEHAGKVIGEKGMKPKHWRWAALAAALIIVFGALAIWNFYFRPAPIEPASVDEMAFPLPDKPSIAVLPFENMSGDPEQDYFSNGLTDQIITSLSVIPRLFVIARNSSFTYKGRAVKVQKVAEELGVRYVLEGGVQKTEDRVRITVQLIDAIKGHHVWSERYDRNLKDLFDLQDGIARQIMTAVQVELTEGDTASRVSGSTSNLKALECYWRGFEDFCHLTKEKNAAARQWLEKAIEHDPNFTWAIALLGYTHLMDATNFGVKDADLSLKLAEDYAQKAISINESTAYAQALMGVIRRNQGKWDEAVEYGEKAVAINPNDPLMMLPLALTYHYAGEFDKAITLIEKAMRITPYYPAFYLACLVPSYVLAGRYQESIEASELLLDRTRKGEYKYPHLVHVWLAEAYAGLGQMDKARVQVEKVLKINPEFSLEAAKPLTAFKDRAIKERRLAVLRKAGFPEHPPLPLPNKPSIAVLPFVNMSGDAEQEYFSDGITEEIITALSKIPKMFVIARTSSFKYKGKDIDLRTVGRELGVRYVIEGSVRKAGDKVRITAQLIDAKTDQHLWAERYDRELKDIFEIQDEITMKILAALQVKLTEGEQARVYEKGTNNLEAYLKVLQGRKIGNRFNREANALARKMYEEAIVLDAGYAMAYLRLSATH